MTTRGKAQFGYPFTSITQRKAAVNRKQTPPLNSVQPGVQMRFTTGQMPDRKSTRLNSSHRCISYAAFCLKQNRQLGQRVHLGYQSRQHGSRSLPVPTPRRAEMTCMKMAIRRANPFFNNKPSSEISPLSLPVPHLL